MMFARCSIKPRKGQFIVFSKEAGKLIQHMLLPVPSDKTKGVLVFTSGNMERAQT